MLKRKEFMLGAVVGLGFAAAATAGGVIEWPGAHAQERPAARAGQLVPTAGMAGAAFAPPPGAPLSFADIFDQVAPAVVQIDVRTRVQRPSMGGLERLLPFPFNQLPQAQPRGQAPGESEEDNTIEGAGSGSGFFISADGHIVTNAHVVENAQDITIRLTDRREFKATVVGRDTATDLAVLKVEGSGFPFVSFEEAAEPRVGDWVVAVGNPFSLGGTATAGIVSAKSRELNEASTFNEFIQIDAAINRGNSGGPTFDIYGRVIGVNTAIFSPTGGSVGIGFAIPASVAKQVTDTLMRGEQIERGFIGIGARTLPAEDWLAQGYDEGFRGAWVESVTPGSPAERAGIRTNDAIVAVNGQPVESSQALVRRITGVRVGETAQVELIRDGRRMTVQIRAERRPPESELEAGRDPSQSPGAPNAPAAPTGQEVGGLNVTALTPALRNRYNIPSDVNGILVTGVATGGDTRFRDAPGMVILRAGTRPVGSVADFEAAVRESQAAGREGVFLLIRTPQGNMTTTLRLPGND